MKSANSPAPNSYHLPVATH